MSEIESASSLWKVKIAVLWICGPVLESAHLLFSIDTTGAWLKRLGDLVVHSTFFITLPIILAVLTLILKDKWNQRVNVIFGIIPGLTFYIINFFEFGLGMVPGGYTGPAPGPEQIIILALKVAITALIPWLAWRWPGQVLGRSKSS